MRHFLLLAVVAMITACSPKLDDLQAYTQSVSDSAVPNIEPYPEFAKPKTFIYSASKLPSPFDSPKENTPPLTQTRQQNCFQPDFERSKQKLERYGLDSLELTGNFNSQGVEWALISSNDGILHKVKIGSRIGLFYGKIIGIDPNSLTIEQLIPDGAGCWKKKETTLSKASTPGERNNG